MLFKTYGRIEIVSNVSVVDNNDDDDDDGWGESSPMERQNAPVKREYIIYKAVPDSIDSETYSEDSIAKAIKAIKNAKNAEEKFADKSEDSNEDWGKDDNNEEDPW